MDIKDLNHFLSPDKLSELIAEYIEDEQLVAKIAHAVYDQVYYAVETLGRSDYKCKLLEQNIQAYIESELAISDYVKCVEVSEYIDEDRPGMVHYLIAITLSDYGSYDLIANDVKRIDHYIVALSTGNFYYRLMFRS